MKFNGVGRPIIDRRFSRGTVSTCRLIPWKTRRNLFSYRGFGRVFVSRGGMVQKQAFLRCTSRVYMCNATQGTRGDLHRKRNRFDVNLAATLPVLVTVF